MNQVLIEEIKVKDATIEADILIGKDNDCTEKASIDNEDQPAQNKERNVVKCSICDWKSENQTQLPGHMIKHRAGQYTCEVCKVRFQNKQKLNEHINISHKKQTVNHQNEIRCDVCDKTFASEHSLKQHNSSKHYATPKLPVGHPEKAARKEKENNHADIACVQCGKRFSNGRDVDDHMLTHKDEEENAAFEGYTETRVCRYFRRGACVKGNMCRFVHNNTNQGRVFTLRCAKGQACIFLQQNRCSFFHPGVGVQKPRMQSESQDQTAGQSRECRYKNDCWNRETCPFTHQGFLFVQKMNKPPIGVRNMKVWKN